MKSAITVLIENTTDRTDLVCEHGLSLWIEAGDKKVLMDTGQTDSFLDNAAVLGIDIAQTNGIALSHGHYDHTGGLPATLEKMNMPAVHCHPDVFTPRYTPGKDKGAIRSIGIPYTRDELEAHCTFSFSQGITEIVPGFSMTGEIPRKTDFEDTGGDFYLDSACTKPDLLPDDISFVLETGKAPALILGCCHSGIINTLRYVAEKWDTDSFSLILGGMHLVHAGEERLKKTAAALKEFNIGMLSPGHCTGKKAVTFLAEAFPKITKPITTGWNLEV